MLPSTRTPEGEPLRCSICGQEHLVLLSAPPNDSVCPSCGSHAWIVVEDPNRLESIGRDRIRLEVQSLVELLRFSSSKVELAEYLTSGLVRCLAAHGSTVWMLRPEISLLDRTDEREVESLERIGFNGETHDERFANIVAAEKQETMRIEFGGTGERLRIGVPLKNRQGLVGVIEVSQRPNLNRDARTGYIRFVRSIASVIEGHCVLQ
jgi:hypothetical protein